MNLSIFHFDPFSMVINAFDLLGDFVYLFINLNLLWVMWKTKSCIGISAKSQVLFAVVWTARYFDVFIKFISVYHVVVNVLFIIISYAILATMFLKFRKTYDRSMDTFCAEFLVLPCLLFALFTYSPFSILKALWLFSTYLEVVAILPQLFMITKCGQWNSTISQYLLGLTAYRSLCVIVWICLYYSGRAFDPITCVAGGIQAMLLWSFFISIYVDNGHGQSKERDEEGRCNASYAQRMMESLADIIYGSGDHVYGLNELQAEIRRRGIIVKNEDLKRNGYTNFKMFVEDQPWLVLYNKNNSWFVRRRRDHEKRLTRPLVDCNKRLKDEAEMKESIEDEYDEEFIDPYDV